MKAGDVYKRQGATLPQPQKNLVDFKLYREFQKTVGFQHHSRFPLGFPGTNDDEALAVESIDFIGLKRMMTRLTAIIHSRYGSIALDGYFYRIIRVRNHIPVFIDYIDGNERQILASCMNRLPVGISIQFGRFTGCLDFFNGYQRSVFT